MSRPVTEAAEQLTPRSPDLLEVHSLSVKFGGVVALQDVDLSLGSVACCGIIGPNGAGKTTLFNALTGYVRPRSGLLRFDGTDITRLAPHKRSRIGLRRTFQDSELFDDLTVEENLGVAADRSTRQEIPALLDDLGLTKLARRACRDLPGGLRREVGVARALASKPKMVLLDEPGAGLNHTEVIRFGQVLRRACDARNIALVLVDHDMTLINEVCERVVVLDFGVIIADGTPHDVMRDDDVRKAYLGI